MVAHNLTTYPEAQPGVRCGLVPLTIKASSVSCFSAVYHDPHHHCSTQGSYVSWPPCFLSSPHSHTAAAIAPTPSDSPPGPGPPMVRPGQVLCPVQTVSTAAQQLGTFLQSWLRCDCSIHSLERLLDPQSLSWPWIEQYSSSSNSKTTNTQ